MNINSKTGVIIVVLCLVSAATIIVVLNNSSSEERLPDQVQMLCRNCSYEFKISRTEMARQSKEKLMSNNSTGFSIFSCPECGKESALVAYKCKKCGTVFIPDYSASNDNIYTCPSCSYNELKDRGNGVKTKK